MDFNNQSQVSSPNAVMSTHKELFQQFWQHYTQAFYNYNMAQFAQLSSQFKVPMPMPANIRKIGDKYLRSYFDEVWGEVDFGNHELHQQPRSTYNNATAIDYEIQNNAAPIYKNARPSDYEIQNDAAPAYNNGKPKYNNVRPADYDPMDNARPAYKDFNNPRSYNNDGNNYHQQNVQQRNHPYNNNQRSRGKPNTRGWSRGGPQNSDRNNWFRAKPKSTYTNLSDDEDSQRAFGSSYSDSSRNNNFNKKVSQKLGFIDLGGDEKESGNRDPLCRMG